MAYKLTVPQFNQYLQGLEKEYTIFAPANLAGKGAFTDTDVIRYRAVNSFAEIEFANKSGFSAKEILTPITQTLFYFTEDHWNEPKVQEKKILLFLRSCDIHGIKRLDDIYLKNGQEDPYYKVFREKTKFCLIECAESFENCFCVSMNTNVTDEYHMFLHIEDDFVYLGLNHPDLPGVEGETAELSPRFIMQNKTTVRIPENITQETAKLPLWEEYTARCLGCGRCSFVCPTCSCFSMQDIFYKENANVGERRRVWASCMVDGYTDMAGGHSFRQKQGERMRFRVMHKMHDYKKRFGYAMCVGCGRCEDICPEYISLTNCINKLNHTGEENQ